MLLVNFQVVVKENKFMDDREYTFDELLELVADYVTLLRSLRKLGSVDMAKTALSRCAFYFGALVAKADKIQD